MVGVLAVGAIWMTVQGAVALFEWAEETGYKPDDYQSILFTGVCMACMGIQSGLQVMHGYNFGMVSVALLGIGAVFIVGGYYEQ